MKSINNSHIATATTDAYSDQWKGWAFFLWLSVFLLVWSISLTAQNKRDAYKTFNFSVDNFPKVEAITSGGHIELIGGNSNEVEVQVFVKKGNKFLDESDYGIGDDYDLKVVLEGNTIVASAESKGKGWSGWINKRPSVSYKIFLPRESNADLKTSGGHVSISMIEGDVQMRTSGGHLNIKEFTGNLEGRTSGGHINMDVIEGKINVKTSGGHINLTDATGNFEVRTSGGHINVEKLYGSISGKTSGGHINVELTSLTGDIELSTSGGNVNVEMPSSSQADLDIRASRVRANLVNFTGNQSKDEIEGKINGGGFVVNLRTSGGVAEIDLR